MPPPDNRRRPTEALLRQTKLETFWEVLARVDADPARAVWYMAEHQRLVYTEAQAVAELAAAKHRNRLALVRPDELRSRFARRVHAH